MAKNVILIADDDLDVTEYLTEAIKAEMTGFEVNVSRNGIDAAHVFRRKGKSIALILVDMLLPVHQGKLALLDRFEKEAGEIYEMIRSETDRTKEQGLRDRLASHLRIMDTLRDLTGGAVFIEEISSPGKLFSLPTIYETALHMKSEQMGAIAGLHKPGTIAWMFKPYTSREMITKIKSMLGRAS